MTMIALLATAFLSQEPMRISMISLGVKDMEASVRFYRDTLALAISGKPGEVTVFEAGTVKIALNRPLGRAAGSDRMTGAVEVIFAVASVNTAYKQLSDRGCRFLREPREVTPGTWAATFVDPDGHRLTVLGPG